MTAIVYAFDTLIDYPVDDQPGRFLIFVQEGTILTFIATIGTFSILTNDKTVTDACSDI
jgi:hypothetical protein